MEITYTKISPAWSSIESFLVNASGLPIGFIEKFKKTAGHNHPWKAFGVTYDPADPNQPMYDHNTFQAFYGSHARENAVNYLRNLAGLNASRS